MGLGKQFRNFLSIASFRADAGLGIVGSPSPDSDYWYTGVGYRSAAGPNVSPATATRLGAVFACTRVITETLGSLPCGIYRERKSGGRDAATDHPAQELFLKPNPWQTGMEFFETIQAHLELRGNSYALKVPGNGRAIDELIPLHPDRVRVFLLPNNRLRYEVTSYSTGQIDKYTQDEILHFRGCWSYDGIMGISTVSAMSEVIGVGLAQQEHRARYFRNSAIPSLSIETLKMTDEAREEMVNSISAKFSGEGSFKVMALPPGMKATALGLTNKDSQLIEASAATRTEICAAWRVPPHKIADLTRGTFSNIEQQNIEFATDCIRPRVVRMERRLDSDIIEALGAFDSSPGQYYVVFNMDALFRGDMKSRYDAYAAAMPWMLRNEMRAAEGKNPIDGLDEPLVAVNMETVSQADARSKANIEAKQNNSEESDTEDAVEQSGGSAETPSDDEVNEDDATPTKKNAEATQLRALALASAGRIVRREVKALRKLAPYAALASFSPNVWELYRDLSPVIAESLIISLDEAHAYCWAHAKAITVAKDSQLDTAIDTIEDEAPAQLADLTLRVSRISEKRLIA